MEDIRFQFSDPYERPISPSFFNMSNPTLADLSINNNNGPTAMSHQNHHEVFQQRQNSNYNGVLQQRQSGNYNDPFSNSLLSQQNHHGVIQQGHGSNFDQFPTPLSHQQNNRGSNNDDLFTIIQQSKLNHHEVLQQGQGGNNNNNNNNETFSHPMVEDQNVNNNFTFGGNNFEVGSTSQIHDNQNQPANDIPVLLNHAEVLALDQWPPAPLPYFCSCCHVLREIIHANGIQFEKLEIHGRLGLITHAIHHQTPVNGDAPIYQMVDFCRRSLEEIKIFLAQYCVERNRAGYFILQDPMSAYYETLCTGLDWIEDLNMEDPVDANNNNNQNNSDEIVEPQEQEGENGTPTKKNLSVQRKKAGKLTLNDLCDLFHLPIEEASECVKLCPTVVKKTCRKAGLARWPYRKVKSILKQIELLGSQLHTQDPATRARTQEEINRLKHEMIQHCGGQIPTAMYNIPPLQQQQHQHQQQ